jgi:23S rRNA (guanosine2251-2'-O)-methyltransferase
MAPRIIYGIHPVLEQLRAGRTVERLYLLRGRRDRRMAEVEKAASKAGAALRYEDRLQLDRMAGTTHHQGVVAMVGEQGYVELEALLERSKAGSHAPLLVLLDEVEDPHNVGAIIRTAEAAGAQGILIPARRSAGLTPTVVKASAGAVAHLPVARVGNVAQTIDALKTARIWVTGLTAEAPTVYTAVDWTVPSVLVAGAEGKGLRQLVKERCDQLASIPLLGRVDSLNVSVAVGVVLYEIVRQRARRGTERAGSTTSG